MSFGVPILESLLGVFTFVTIRKREYINHLKTTLNEKLFWNKKDFQLAIYKKDFQYGEQTQNIIIIFYFFILK